MDHQTNQKSTNAFQAGIKLAEVLATKGYSDYTPDFERVMEHYHLGYTPEQIADLLIQNNWWSHVKDNTDRQSANN